MWLLHIIQVGYYSIFLWPFHIPLWATGYLIRDKMRSRRSRIIWLSVLVVGLIFCELLCDWLTIFDRLGGFIAMAVIFDLVIGYFVKDLGRTFQALVDWINRNEDTEEE